MNLLNIKTNKKKRYFLVFFLTFFLVGSMVFLSGIKPAYAWGLADVFAAPFKLILLGIFTLFGWLASVAITLFEWVIKPENISGSQGVLNLPVVYETWKFVRDFFNLFFILILLYIAFCIVFQLAKDYKKTILHLVIMALLVNFSYPISRAFIDATNVPMYFFANQMMAGSGRLPGEGGTMLSSALSASQLKGILIRGAENGGSVTLSENTFARLFVAIVFMFLFSVTLLVLAVMFVIRLVALVILVVFSAVGFAASIYPGLDKYSSQWWQNFWKYSLFGPAAMLMLLVSVRFFSALGDTNSGIFRSIRVSATEVSADPTFFASMAMFSIPIIMLWFAMSLAQTMSLAGAGAVVGFGQKISKWMGAAPFRVGWVWTKWAGRKIDKAFLAKRHLSPKAWIAGVKEYWAKQEHEDNIPVEKAKGWVHNAMNKTVGRLPWAQKDNFNYELAEIEKVKAEKKKEAIDSAGGVKDQSVALRMLKEGEDEHDEEKILGAMDMLAETNGWNDYIRGQFVKDEHGKIIEDAEGKPIPMEMNSQNVGNEMNRLFAMAGIKDEKLRNRLKTNLALRGEGARNWALAGLAIGNEEGEFNSSTPEVQAEYVSWKFQQEDAQAAMRQLHPDSVFTSHLVVDPTDPTGKRKKTQFEDLNGIVGESILKSFHSGHVANSTRTREFNTVLLRQLRAAVKDKSGETNKELQKAYKNFKGFKMYCDKIIKDGGESTGMQLNADGNLEFGSGRVTDPISSDEGATTTTPTSATTTPASGTGTPFRRATGPITLAP